MLRRPWSCTKIKKQIRPGESAEQSAHRWPDDATALIVEQHSSLDWPVHPSWKTFRSSQGLKCWVFIIWSLLSRILTFQSPGTSGSLVLVVYLRLTTSEQMIPDSQRSARWSSGPVCSSSYGKQKPRRRKNVAGTRSHFPFAANKTSSAGSIGWIVGGRLIRLCWPESGAGFWCLRWGPYLSLNDSRQLLTIHLLRIPTVGESAYILVRITAVWTQPRLMSIGWANRSGKFRKQTFHALRHRRCGSFDKGVTIFAGLLHSVAASGMHKSYI